MQAREWAGRRRDGSALARPGARCSSSSLPPALLAPRRRARAHRHGTVQQKGLLVISERCSLQLDRAKRNCRPAGKRLPLSSCHTQARGCNSGAAPTGARDWVVVLAAWAGGRRAIWEGEAIMVWDFFFSRCQSRRRAATQAIREENGVSIRALATAISFGLRGARSAPWALPTAQHRSLFTLPADAAWSPLPRQSPSARRT